MYHKQIGIWIFCGVFMLYVQIILGGITRLTGSGLSITKWEIVTGTIPPLNNSAWETEFNHYKATPQYQKLNEGMTISEFKFIYFWEYFHRLWARLMGFVFAIPFFYFLFTKRFDKKLTLSLLLVVLMASLTASFGWIMVKSGLVDRPWVNPYKLTVHLSLALLVYGYVLWLALRVTLREQYFIVNERLKKFSLAILVLLCFQLVLGGLMSGMKAGLYYPTFPDMHGQFIPAALLSTESWSFDSFFHFDKDHFAVAFIHFFHRMIAYSLAILILCFYFVSKKQKLNQLLSFSLPALVLILLTQITLGILTVLHSKSGIPVTLGVLHQAVAVLLFTTMLWVHFMLRNES